MCLGPMQRLSDSKYAGLTKLYNTSAPRRACRPWCSFSMGSIRSGGTTHRRSLGRNYKSTVCGISGVLRTSDSAVLFSIGVFLTTVSLPERILARCLWIHFWEAALMDVLSFPAAINDGQADNSRYLSGSC